MKGLPPILRFLQAITAAPSTVFNPWTQSNHDDLDSSAISIRRDNLGAHLNIRKPRLIMVGEAPGYRGCRMSGVPFTSERQIMKGAIPRVLFPMLVGKISSREFGWSESSATVVWNLLHEIGLSEGTILWNACPWHPFAAGPLTNRAPGGPELTAGEPALRALLDLFPTAEVIAIGRVASAQIQRVGHGGRIVASVRHPAFGGANLFRQAVMDAVGFTPAANPQLALESV